MLYESFYGDSITDAMQACIEWMKAHNPANPVIVIMEQGTHYNLIRVYCDDYS